MGFASHFCVFYFNTHFGEWKLLFLVHGGKVWAFFFWKIALGKIVSSRWLVWALLGFLPLPRYSLRVVSWSRLRRPTFQRRKVGKVRRACGPGPGVGGRRWGLRGLQALWLLPAVLDSALNTSAAQCGPSGGYPPCKTCRQFRWRGWSTCRLSDCQPLQDGFGVESVRRETCSLMFFANSPVVSQN